MYCDSEGLNQGALLEGDLVGELVAEILSGGVEAGESSIVGWGGGEAHVRAKVVVAAQARLAVAAGRSRLNGDAVAEFERLDLRTDSGNGAGGFVAEAHGGLEDEGADGAMLPVVNVRTADSGVFNGDEDRAGVGEGGNWALFIGDLEGRVEDEGKVLGGVRRCGGSGGQGIGGVRFFLR